MALETIKKLLADYKHIDENTITRETTFESMGIDSLDTVDLVIDLEETFHIVIERDDTIETVGELADIIDELRCQEVKNG